MSHFKSLTLEWSEDRLKMIDQRKLPTAEEYVECRNHEEVYVAIREMIVRGAPAIGATAAFGYLLGAKEVLDASDEVFLDHMTTVKKRLSESRPTAVNLFWALDRMENALNSNWGLERKKLIDSLERAALSIAKEDIEINKSLGRNGATVVRDGDGILTHCNAGALATVDYGTALGVMRAAVEQGKRIKIFADETRPYLQGARLTAWELIKSGIDVTLICDNMAGWVMKKGFIDLVLVGADRIAANGDAANKIGTYSVAVLAQRHGIPFYIAAPLSTVDLTTASGEEIPIEERSHREITHIGNQQIAPEGVRCLNPAFDVTPSSLITGIITEKGIARPPYDVSLREMFEENPEEVI
ncbi:S-methyl-5-thioribose-1-phosphate isomerase [Mesotoga prima]|uniref:S-methyl-5-thioribose-1-phosphate isomerase n=1 Tax=Mesotoga prima TaxID=1184387 RepID=UPI002598201D|nr:S-methyl-5-thioribose-1-phosphate isomerase [Mesotoga prima]HOP37566.1 S-methyl-5-thioribose-1-phosphate isomerase [Mesotoga prima]